MTCDKCGSPTEAYQGWWDREVRQICTAGDDCRPDVVMGSQPRIEGKWLGATLVRCGGEAEALAACKARPQVIHVNQLMPKDRPAYWIRDADGRLWGIMPDSHNWEEFLG